MPAAPLTSLFFANRGNISDKWEQYLAVYDAELRPWYQQRVSLLEIGVQNGGSMQVWSQYFDPASVLVGLDIDERIASLDPAPNVELFVADGTDPTQLFGAIGDHTFDIIIDDGSHFSSDIANSFRLLFTRLNPGGRYFLEDLHCSYWPRFGGGLRRPDSAIEFLKQLVDVLHYDHLEDLDELRADVDDELLLALRSGIARLTFYDSLAVVERLPFDKVGPYRRVLAGDEGDLVDPVELMSLEEPGRLMFTQPLARTLESGVLRRLEELHASKREIEQLKFQYKSLTEQLASEQRNSAAIDADRAVIAEQRDFALATIRDNLSIPAMAGRMRAMHQVLQSAEDERRVAGTQADEFSRRTIYLEARVRELEGRSQLEIARSMEYGQMVVHLRNEVSAIERSTTYRLTEPLRLAARAARKLRRVLGTPQGGEAIEAPADWSPDQSTRQRPTKMLAESRSHRARQYQEWREEFVCLSPRDRELIDAHVSSGTLPPVTVMMTVDTSDILQVEAALRALTDQRLSLSQAWLDVAEGCENPATDALLERQVGIDQRFHRGARKTEPAPFNGVTVLTVASTTLHEHALYLFAAAIQSGSGLAYADVEVVLSDGSVLPDFKPCYSPLHQQLHRYIGSTVAVDTSLPGVADALSGQDAAQDRSTTIDTVIASVPAHGITRIPFIAQTETVVGAVPSATPLALSKPPRISIIIPTRDRLELLEPCIRSILDETDYPLAQIELIVVDNGSTDQTTLEYLRRLARRGTAIVIRDDGNFNYPRLNNRAAEAATGEVLILLNNDTTVLDAAWLKTMVAYAAQPEVGAVGAKLLYPDSSTQHGGVVLGIQGVAAHVNHMLAINDPAYHEIADCTHEVSAITGACLAIRTDVYRKIGGLDESMAVTFNDIDLCCSSLHHGYRNIYIGTPLMIHHESKSRGLDLLPEQHESFRQEAIRARTKFPELYRDDPYYNPNLSLHRAYDLGEPPRAIRPWYIARRLAENSRCVLMLSSTHQVGHGVAVVVDIQARHLAALGHRVIVGGPRSTNEFPYEGCERVVLDTPIEAAMVAHDCGADVVMMHTPPFFATSRWLGGEPLKIAYDYGEPNPEFFPDVAAREGVLAEKRFSIALADARFAISDAVRAESSFDDIAVLPLGNAHLATWGPSHEAAREELRRRHGWSDKVVVFNVCRFHGAERNYKGVDAYSILLQVIRTAVPELADKLVFVLCGKGDEQDIREMEAAGLAVYPNVSDNEMVDLYAAADAYVNLSRWEGYNLGIGQALAMGLPTLASDIPAHRAFGITTTNDIVEQIQWLEHEVASAALNDARLRTPKVWSWDAPLQQLTDLIESAC